MAWRRTGDKPLSELMLPYRVNRPQGTYFNEIVVKIQKFSLMKMHLNMSPLRWRPSCLGLNVLIEVIFSTCLDDGGNLCKILVTVELHMY